MRSSGANAVCLDVMTPDRQARKCRPPVWCIANGWDGDIDDGEAAFKWQGDVHVEMNQVI